MMHLIRIICIIAVIMGVAEAAGRRPPKDTPAIETVTHTDIAPAIVPHPSLLVYDSLNWKIPLGDQYRVQLKNGPVAFVAADSSLPLVNIEAYLRCGSLTDPDGKEGLGSLMTRVMRTGGTEHYPADTLDMLIDLLAMKFSFSQTESHIEFGAAFLSEYIDTAMHIMKQMFFHPVFDEAKFERERAIMTENIRHRFANPGPTLSIAYRKHNYQGSAPAKILTAPSLEAINRNDIVALHKTAFGTREIIISVSGKFNRDEMISKLNAVFAEPVTVQCPIMPEIKIAPQTRALVVHKKINQTYIRMGVPLFMRPHPDYYSVSLMNYILGGSGFISRLGTRVRSDEGLTYSIHSRAESNYTYSGTLYVDFFTNTESYPKAVSIILEELDKIIKDGVTEIELENAVSALISELPSSFRSPEDIASTYAWNEFYGRAPDHYAKYPEELMKITREDIKNAAKKYIDINKITYTIVGDTAAINAVKPDGLFDLDALKSKRVIVADSLVSYF